MALSEYFIQELKARNDLSEIASSYVTFRRSGKNLLGLCPFHNEKTPSFNIYPENGSFYCFGCSAGGDVISFIMRIERLDYIEAVRFLAQRAGMQMPEKGIDDSMSKLRARILEINRETARFFHNTLFSPQGVAGMNYIKKRLPDSKTIRHFGIGYATDTGFALVNHLKSMGFQKDELVQANVAGVSQKGNLYDRFRSRLMFPIIDLRGNVVAFGGRILTDEKPKYINTSDTPVYKKSSGLFAMNFAKNSDKKQIILAEGYMDVIALHRAGFTNAIASLGTSFTEEQARVISRYADEVVICYDGDEAGQKATQRAISILRKTGLFIKVVTLQGSKDPDEFMQKHGKDGPIRFQDLIDKSGDDVAYILNKIKAKYILDTAEGRIKYLKEATQTLAGIDSDITRGVFAAILSEETEVLTKTILDDIERIRKSNFRKSINKLNQEQNVVSASKVIVNTEKKKNTRAANAEEAIIAYLIKHTDKIDELSRRISPDSFATAFNRRIYKLLIEKNKQGSISFDFSGDLTNDEMSEFSKITHENQRVVGTWQDIMKSVDILQNTMFLANEEQLKSATYEDIDNSLKKLRKQKQGD